MPTSVVYAYLMISKYPLYAFVGGG